MAKSRTIKVGTARAEPGRHTTGALILGEYPDAPITTAVNILCGAKPGPVLWVQAAIHGSECGGALGLLRLAERIDLKTMSGTIIGIMSANPTAFRVLQRNTPYDGENMNRLFGPPAYTNHSRQSAAILFENAMRVADAIMDMHSGGIDSEVPFYAIYWEDGSETAKEARRLAEAAATPDIWASDDAWIRGAMYANATMKGVPGLIIECGSGGHLTDTDIEHHAAAIGGVATAMGIIPGTPPRQKRYRYVGTCELCWNQRGGFFLPATKVGAVVEKGDLIGRMMDSHGRIVEEIRSPNGPAFVAALARPYRAIHSGTMVAETAILRGGKA